MRKRLDERPGQGIETIVNLTGEKYFMSVEILDIKHMSVKFKIHIIIMTISEQKAKVL